MLLLNSEPKAPAAARIMAANSLIDRGWGKAAQLVDVQGEVKQLVEVKLSVVQSSHVLPNERVLELKPNDLAYETNSLPNSRAPGDAGEPK